MANVAEESIGDAKAVLCVTTSSSGNEWMLDSECSSHMTPYRNRFTTYQIADGGRFFMGNNVPCKIVEIWTIQI